MTVLFIHECFQARCTCTVLTVFVLSYTLTVARLVL